MTSDHNQNSPQEQLFIVTLLLYLADTVLNLEISLLLRHVQFFEVDEFRVQH